MKKILMIGTGGTIASKQTENGLAPGLTPNDILACIPQVKHVCEVETLQVCNIDSTNVTPEHWKLMVLHWCYKPVDFRSEFPYTKIIE